MAWHTVFLSFAPYALELAKMAVPHFTKRTTTAATTDPGQITQQQITELQSAVTQNAEHIRLLANDMKEALGKVEQGSAVLEARLRRLETMAFAALVVAVVAVGAVFALWLR